MQTLELEKLILNNFRGMNRLSDRLNMNPEFAWDIHNGYIEKDIKSGLGVISQRGGIAKLNTVTFTNPCKYIFEAKWHGGGTDILIREGTRWAKYDGVSGFENLDTARADGARGQAAMFNNQVIMADGAKLRKSTAAYVVSDLSSDTAMPTDSTAVHVHNHKVWTNSTANPMKAYYCKTDSANAADSWSAADDAGSLDFSLILPFGDTLLGFKTFSKIYLVFIFRRHIVIFLCGTDPTEFALQQILPVNCVSWHGVIQIANDLAIPSLEGVNSLQSSLTNQDLDVDDLSRYISPFYRILLSQLSDKAALSAGFSHDRNHLYVCIPIAGGHNILVYSLDIKNFVGRWTGFSAHSFYELIDGRMLAGGDGYVYIMNTGTNDDSAAINFSYVLPFLYGRNPDANKAFRQIEGVVTSDGSATLVIDYTYSIEGDQGTFPVILIPLISEGGLWDVSPWDTTPWAGAASNRFLTSDILGRGKQFGPTFSNYTLDAYVKIFYMIFRYREEGIKIR